MTLVDRLTLFIRCFAEQLWSIGVTTPGNPITHAGVSLIMSRIQAIPRQVQAIIARLAAGPLRPRAPQARRMPTTKPRPPIGRWPQRMPNHHAWLVRLSLPFAPYRSFAPFGSQLEHLLRDPELRALIEKAPQLRRIFRPLCRMLGATVLKPPPPAPTTHPRSPPAPPRSLFPSDLLLQPPISKLA